VTKKCSGTGAKVKCTLSGQLRVDNRGNKPAQRSKVKFYLSQDAAVSVDDTVLGLATVPPIKPGKFQKVRLNKRLTTGVNPAGVRVIGVVGAGNSVKETNERNNVAASAIIP